jgi:succinate dehydrogenase / fumarate reductase, membrane anchor subunit
MVKAGHGFSDWAWQRISAGLMLIYLIMLTVRVAIDGPQATGDGMLNFSDWRAWCQPMWFKLSSLIFAWALIYHAWIGVKEITMDYLHHPVVRERVQRVCAILSWIYAVLILLIVWNT